MVEGNYRERAVGSVQAQFGRRYILRQVVEGATTIYVADAEVTGEALEHGRGYYSRGFRTLAEAAAWVRGPRS